MIHQILLILVGIACALDIPMPQNTAGCGLQHFTSQNCSETKIRACLNNTRPASCRDSVMAPVIYTNCCMTCTPPPCFAPAAAAAAPRPYLPPCDLTLISVCTNGQIPTFSNSACPSCLNRTKVECKNSSSCAVPLDSIRSCSSGETPTRNSSCCPSCIPRRLNCNDSTVIAKCAVTAANLPTCTADHTSMFDSSSCCSSGCICPPPPDASTCTVEQFTSCITSTNECQTGEIACYIPGSCCPSCRSSVWQSRAEDIAKCLLTRPECDPSEVPDTISGEICDSCVVKKPRCNLTCTDNHICVYDWDTTLQRPKIPLVPKCVSKVVIAATIKAAETVLASIKSLDADGLVLLILQYIERYCDIPENVDACAAHAEEIHNIECVIVDLTMGSFEIHVPTDDTTASGKRSSPTSSDQIVSGSLSSSTTTGDVNITTTSSNSTSNNQTSDMIPTPSGMNSTPSEMNSDMMPPVVPPSEMNGMPTPSVATTPTRITSPSSSGSTLCVCVLIFVAALLL